MATNQVMIWTKWLKTKTLLVFPWTSVNELVGLVVVEAGQNNAHDMDSERNGGSERTGKGDTGRDD